MPWTGHTGILRATSADLSIVFEGGEKMMPNEADLLAYATGFARRHRDYAVPYAREYAEKLRSCGDREGCAVWHRVADAIANGEVDTAPVTRAAA
ncbi:hypothetical protein CKO28_09325 [Rhodovibrio sodomensis]|uniref:Uncharacterized protein n=1 Tax=Rhodovibrio sodomensis TaxID=1088 RepID=A0ABS1DCQ3_9PROT|nr:hypothetical protein [Rhodovibrio sodomensis]